MVDLDSSLFTSIRDLIHEATGLYFEENKRYFFVRRLEQRMEATGAVSPRDYYYLLCSQRGEMELFELAEALTTNETYFFREYPQLQAFADTILPEIMEAKRKRGESSLRIWSAGCSTGEEPYTLSIILREVIDDYSNWRVTLSATDISQDVLRTARRGLYGERSLRDIPTVYREKYFTQVGQDSFQLSQKIMSSVDFRCANLLKTSSLYDMDGQDFIFCRNVLIYFSDKAQKQVVNFFYDCLRTGGYIFLGHSESVGRITSAFRLVRKGDMLVYTKG